jgi:hypothetical protein
MSRRLREDPCYDEEDKVGSVLQTSILSQSSDPQLQRAIEESLRSGLPEETYLPGAFVLKPASEDSKDGRGLERNILMETNVEGWLDEDVWLWMGERCIDRRVEPQAFPPNQAPAQRGPGPC